MDLKDNIVPSKLPKEVIIGVIEYKDNKLLIKYKDTNYDLIYNINDYSSLYSLPTNNIHLPWTIKHTTKLLTRPDVVIQYWSAFKPGMKLRGIIKNNKFVIISIIK